MKKISEIKENEIVSILDGTILITKLDSLILLVSKSGIFPAKDDMADFGMSCDPADKKDLFTMVANIVNSNGSWNTEHYRELINTRFVMEEA